MTLEDAIVYYSEMAKECRRKARIESNDYMDMKDRAYEAEQLADWLNELKVLRERIEAQPEIIRCRDCKHRDEYGCCKQWKGLLMSAIPIATDDDDFLSYAKRRTEWIN